MTTNPTIAKDRVAALALLAAVLIAAVAGCASGGSGIQAGSRVDVYVSMPLHGPETANGRDVVHGARLALADAGGKVGELEVRATYLDDATEKGWSAAAAAANARKAAQDSAAIAYIGDFDSGATRFSLPITNEAHLLQVSPAASAVDLVQPYLGAGDQVPEEVQPTGDRTFGRVIPSDEAQARAGAIWAKRLGSKEVVIARGRSRYDEVVAAAFREEAGSLGLKTAGSASKVRSKGDLVYAAFESSEKPRIVAPIVRLMGTDALMGPSVPRWFNSGRQPHQLLLTSAAEDPRQLPPEGQRFLRNFRGRYHREPGRYAAYGYEAMAVVLNSIRRAGDSGDDRDSVVDSFFDTSDRRSVLGTYSIDEVGNTTLDRLAGYRVINGQPRFETALSANQ